MKKIISILLTLLLILSVFPSGLFAITANAQSEGYYTYSVSDGRATITSVNKSISGDITIPSTLGGYPVTDISYEAFYGCTQITRITIPSKIVNIGRSAFNGCTKLVSITLLESNSANSSSANFVGFQSIGEYAFANCTSLTNVTIPNRINVIGKGALKGCTSLQKIAFPIARSSFLDTDSYNQFFGNIFGAPQKPSDSKIYGIYNAQYVPSSLKTVVITGGRIIDYSFYGCANIEEIIIKEGLAAIGNNAFSGCTNLKAIYIPDYVTKIGTNAFEKCNSITIYGFKGSTAEKEAQKANIAFISSNRFTDSFGETYVSKQDGWISVNGKWYCYEKGIAVKNAWRKDSVGTVYLGSDGAMLTNAWCIEPLMGWRYVGADGYVVKNCWKKDSSGWIWLNAKGYITKNSWVYDGGKWYYLDANGYMVSNQWRKDSVGWVYLGSSGAMLTNTWCTDSQGWCYVGANGYAVTNCWKKDSIGWCYLGSSGSQVKNNWVFDGGKWYYIGANGYMLYNTSRYIKNKTYHFNSSGVCTNP